MYVSRGIRLSDDQKRKLAAAARAGRAATIELTAADMHGPDQVNLTQRQISHLDKALREGKGARITFSKTQLGGFAQLLIPLAAAILPSLVSWGLDKLSGKGLKKNGQRGRGMYQPGMETMGLGMYQPGMETMGLGARRRGAMRL
jgi:hypothetical protein